MVRHIGGSWREREVALPGRHGHGGRPACAAALTAVAALAAGCGGSGTPASSASHPSPSAQSPAAPGSSAPPSSAAPTTPSSATATPASTSRPPASRPVRSPFAAPLLRRYLASRSGSVTAAIYDSRTRRIWVYHPRLHEYTASIVKVEIMGTALAEAQQSGHGLPSSESALIPTMIENSNNDAATAMLHNVGGPSAVARFDQSVGMTQTTPSTLALIPGTDLPGWGLTTTTARDEAILVSRFAYPSSVLSDASRHYGLNLMENIEADQRWGVTGGVPAGTTVALKNGWLPISTTNWQIDSIGWISGHGRNYVLAVLTAANPTEAYGIDTIDTIASDVYRILGR
jgi:Beta-lactamase enzyme family